jgi:hypothetical protein
VKNSLKPFIFGTLFSFSVSFILTLAIFGTTPSSPIKENLIESLIMTVFYHSSSLAGFLIGASLTDGK